MWSNNILFSFEIVGSYFFSNKKVGDDLNLWNIRHRRFIDNVILVFNFCKYFSRYLIWNIFLPSWMFYEVWSFPIFLSSSFTYTLTWPELLLKSLSPLLRLRHDPANSRVESDQENRKTRTSQRVAAEYRIGYQEKSAACECTIYRKKVSTMGRIHTLALYMYVRTVQSG